MIINTNDILSCQFFSEEECKEIIQYIKNKRKFFQQQEYANLNESNVYNSNSQITTTLFDKYNFFYDNPQYIDRFVDYLTQIIPNLQFPIAVQSWVNVYEKGDGIKPHSHHGLMFHSFAANIFIGGPTDPGITYMEPGWKKTIKNQIGCMHIFDCSLWHTVPPNTSNEPRYSVGITIHSYEALTKELISGSCSNSNYRDIMLLTNNHK